MLTEEIISKSIQIVEYTGEDRPLKFSYILDASSTPRGLTDFVIKDVGVPLSDNNLKITLGTVEYSEAPSVTITGGGGKGATATVTLNSDPKTIQSIKITNEGAGYTSAPVITLSGGKVSKEGTETKIEVVFPKPNIFVEPISVLPNNVYVWIDGKGAYITQNDEWIFLEDLTNLFTKIDKIYTTTSNGAYISNRHVRINDVLNQISYLKREEGYIVIPRQDQTLPFVWYSTGSTPTSTKFERIAFDIEQCFNINKQEVNFIDNNVKAIRLDQKPGTCKEDYTAIVSVVINLTNLKKNTDYHVHLDSEDTNVIFVNQDFYLNKNQLPNRSIYAKVKFVNNTNNNIFTIVSSLNIGATNIDKDILSIYVDCDSPPQSPTFRLSQPIVRSVE